MQWKDKKRKINRDSFVTIICLLGIVLLSSIPLLTHNFNSGVDTRFHMNRIEGIVQEAKALHLPVRISSYFMNGYGYPTSIYYGDILLYLPAFLRTIGFTVMGAYKAYIWFINIITVLISYYSFSRILKLSFSKNLIYKRAGFDVEDELADGVGNIQSIYIWMAGLIGTMAYTLSTIRLMDIYIRGAVGEYSAMAFLPLVVLGVWEIYCEDRAGILHLAIGMSGLIETHMITTEITVFLLVLVCIILIKHTLKWSVIKGFLLAAGLTVLINLWFVVPFIDYFINENVLITSNLTNTEGIQFGGVYLIQYLMFFMNPFGANTVDLSSRLATIPGMLLTFGYLGAIGLLVSRRLSNYKEMKFVILISSIILFVSTNLFPWDFLSSHTTIGQLMIQIQYPWRYIPLACVMMALLLAMVIVFIVECGQEKVLCEKSEQKNYGIRYKRFITEVAIVSTVISIVSVAVFTVQYYQGSNLVYYEDETSLWVDEVGMGEYLKVGNDRDSIVGMGNDILTKNVSSVEVLEHKGTDYTIQVVTNSACDVGTTKVANLDEISDIDGIFDVGAFINMPVFNYKGYHVTDSDGTEYEIIETDNGRITFEVPFETDDIFYICFKEPWYWRMAEVMSLIAIIEWCILFIRNVKRYK